MIMSRWIRSFLCFIFIIFFSAQAVHAQQLSRIESHEVTVLCEKTLVPAAREVITLYSALKAELEATFLWDIDFKPVVVLIGQRGIFQQMSGHRSFVAYAIPQKELIVVDFTRMNEDPFTLEVTLKHELCHLLLHRRMEKTDLPKWLDEGVAQWISEGIPEIITTGRPSMLTQAAFAGRLPALESLAYSFPRDEQGLALAYEQSRSIVEFIIDNYGKNGILNILETMRTGAGYRDAILLSLVISYPELEKRWQEDQQSLMAVLSYFAVNLYTIIFVMAALLTFWIYIRLTIRKRRLREEPEDEDHNPLAPLSS